MSGNPKEAEKPSRGFSNEAIQLMKEKFHHCIASKKRPTLQECRVFISGNNIIGKTAKQVNNNYYFNFGCYFIFSYQVQDKVFYLSVSK